MSAVAQEVLERIVTMPLPEYAERFLKIRTKTQGVQPFRFNVGQLYVHRKAEIQLAKRGFVRIDLLKARQWGGSTYIQARAYRRHACGARGQRTFILTHLQDATANLFGMTHRFHNYLNPSIRPYAPRPSKKTLTFPRLDSSYAVATARSQAAGRSDTIQFFHGSEVAFWPNASENLTGALQAVPAQGIGTEVWRESTGNGMGGIGEEWYKAFALSQAGLSDYEAVFVPWFWFDEYRAPTRNLELSGDDEEYVQLWGLDDEQMQFRQNKIIEFGGGEAGAVRFAQEYPATPEEAFSVNVSGGYIQAKYVVLARRKKPIFAQTFGPKIMGIDPTWTGDDRFICMIRHGRRAYRVGRWKGLRAPMSVTRVAAIYEKERPDVITMDVGGLGGPIFDMIQAKLEGTGVEMIPVLGGEEADEPDRWPRKRNECWGRMREWFEDPISPSLDDHVMQGDDYDAGLNEIQGDITCVLTDWDLKSRPTVESKKRVLSHSPSPDNAEALATTFAVRFPPDWKPTNKDYLEERRRRRPNWRAV